MTIRVFCVDSYLDLKFSMEKNVHMFQYFLYKLDVASDVGFFPVGEKGKCKQKCLILTSGFPEML